VQTDRPFLTRASVVLLVWGLFAAACGRSSLEPNEETVLEDAGFESGPDVAPFDAPSTEAIPPFETGPEPDVIPFDGPSEAVGPPPCGNGACEEGETCFSCPRDCGLCPGCPNGKCDNGETCSSCAPDCGPCPGCGDHICEPTENCFTCPEDCGVCEGCGDGKCESDETCASCPADCGVCVTCGDGQCVPPDETCANCPEDCGDCSTSFTCLDVITCAFGCLGETPPSITCATTCIAEGCPNAQVASSAVFNCALQAIAAGTCTPSDVACIRAACAEPIATCLNLSCTEM
jgi:hypothetical protein